MKLTMHKIAREAAVSVATVSRALNPQTRFKVAPRTLTRIERLVARYHYTPNIAAAALRRASFQAIGVVLPHHAGVFLEDYYARLLAGVSDALLSSLYHLTTLLLKCEKPLWDAYRFKPGKSVDGLIVTHWRAFFSNRAVIGHLDVPAVVINDPEPRLRAHCVSGDHLLGGRLAAEHLYTRGHRTIAVLTGPADSSDSALRLKGFTAFLREVSVPLERRLIHCGEFQEEVAYRLTDSVLETRRGLTAVFCCNDEMAFGVMRRLQERGIPCPGRISVMGYDDHRRAATVTPALTTIQVPLYELAQEAARRLVEYLQDTAQRDFFYRTTLLPVKVVPRQSVGRREPGRR